MRFLRDLEAEKHVTVTSARKLTPTEHHNFDHQFKNKKITYLVDPDLLVGVKVTGSDFSYEYSLEKNLADAVNYLADI